MEDIEVVHVIFKTHLDIGFTDLAENVTNQYIYSYIPKAIELAKQLQKDDSNAGFIWTTGSWLIHEYLKQADESQLAFIEEAIINGHISWHGLPFTTHTELMDAELFRYGLSIAKRLDSKYGKMTISAKMTDVPGHTKAIIPFLAQNGIQYLHLGVNPASKVPRVPSIFVWKGSDGSEVIVNYADSYGEDIKIKGLSEVMVFAHTGDNCGPPSKADIKTEFSRLKEKYPNAKIMASTMDQFAAKLQTIKYTFPVIEEEIGDTWIHGVATDPKKVAQYRELLRLRKKWINEGEMAETSEEITLFSDWLLLIPEHTWGLDEKKYLNDYKNYSKKDFTAARKKDLLDDNAVPDKYSYIGSFAMNEFDSLSEEMFITSWNNRSYSLFESSWKEQREYINKAISVLSEERQIEAREALNSLVPKRLKESTDFLRPGSNYKFGKFSLCFSDDGSIYSLIDEKGKDWVTREHRFGVFSYESFGIENYNRWFTEYVQNSSQTYRWSDADQGKPGMELSVPSPKHELLSPRLISISREAAEMDDIVNVKLSLPEHAVNLLGAPKDILIKYSFNKNSNDISIELSWFDKEANRLPEAIWFSFALNVDNPNKWKIDKLGHFVSPLEVIKDGNRNLHAVDTGIYYNGADGKAVIQTLDAPLVSPGEKRLLQFDNTFASLARGFHFNLYNNIWGTNFPMWYDEDAKFRFSIRMTSY